MESVVMGRFVTASDLFEPAFFGVEEDMLLLCEQRFLSCMAFSVYEVVRVAFLSRTWFVHGE